MLVKSFTCAKLKKLSFYFTNWESCSGDCVRLDNASAKTVCMFALSFIPYCYQNVSLERKYETTRMFCLYIF